MTPSVQARLEHRPLRDRFLRWQCRARQIAVREAGGRPDDAVTPALFLLGADEPLGHVITVLSRAPFFSRTPELMHLARRTNDPGERREAALRLLAEAYYQRPQEFSDTLTATFPPGSPGAAQIVAAGACRLVFDAYSQRFDLFCAVRRLPRNHWQRDATWWHNLLFNPDLPADTVVLAFAPDWAQSSAEP